MAYLGLSYVYSGLDNAAAARQFLEKATALAPGVSERERRRIIIREKQLAAIDDIKDTARFVAYKKTIDDALANDLEDPQLCSFAAMRRKRTPRGEVNAAPRRRLRSIRPCCGSFQITPRPITTWSIPTRLSDASTRLLNTARSTHAWRRRFPTRPTCGDTIFAESAASMRR
jgi:hypothetical protein